MFGRAWVRVEFVDGRFTIGWDPDQFTFNEPIIRFMPTNSFEALSDFPGKCNRSHSMIGSSLIHAGISRIGI